jgi:hypothetical protein
MPLLPALEVATHTGEHWGTSTSPRWRGGGGQRRGAQAPSRPAEWTRGRLGGCADGDMGGREK